MVKVQYNSCGKDSSIEMDGTGLDVLTECIYVVHHLYNALYKTNEIGAKMFKKLILQESDHVFSVDDAATTLNSSNLSPEEKERLKKQAEALHGLLNKLDEALKG